MAISRSKWDSFINVFVFLSFRKTSNQPRTPGHPINSRVDALLKKNLMNYEQKVSPIQYSKNII